MKKIELILVGGGDHCKSVIDVIEHTNRYNIIGIIDLEENIGKKILDYKIIGSDDDIPKLALRCPNFFITIGQVKSPNLRIQKFEQLKSIGVRIPTIISPLAYVSKYAKVEEGTLIFPFTMVDVDVNIGKNCIINHHTTIGHGANIEDHSHISANCVLGKCTIGKGAFIGGNSWITNLVSIAPNTVVGSGSNVIKSINTAGIYVGNPAKLLKYHE